MDYKSYSREELTQLLEMKDKTIVELKKLNKAGDASEFKTMLNEIPNAIIRMDLNAKIIWANSVALHMDPDMIGKEIMNLHYGYIMRVRWILLSVP